MTTKAEDRFGADDKVVKLAKVNRASQSDMLRVPMHSIAV